MSPNSVQVTLPKHTDTTIAFVIAQTARQPRSLQVRHSWRNQMLMKMREGGRRSVPLIEQRKGMQLTDHPPRRIAG